jgi:TPR repeat protein
MYYNGQGVPPDYVMAYMWYNLAAAQGDEGAITLRSVLEKKMTPEQIAEAQRLSIGFKVKKP